MSDYANEIAAWREKRLAALTAPDSWLSVVGLHWLSEGENRIGSAEGNDLVVPQLVPQAGLVTLAADGTVTLDLLPEAGGTIDGMPVGRAHLLSDADKGGPTLIRFGTVSFHVIARADGKALRIRDSQNLERLNFKGIEHFPLDPSWRIEAAWMPLDAPRSFEIESLAGGSNTITVRHKAVFERNGEHLDLWPTHGTPDKPMFVLRDRTSGKETYGACRFLTGDVSGGHVLLDFNKAISPPCAFTDFATCPLPPPENVLPLRIEAGEIYTPHS